MKNKLSILIFFSALNLFFSSGTVYAEDSVPYQGNVEHIFVHSLVIYPEKAKNDLKNSAGYKDNMVSVAQFEQIIQELYDRGFILISSDSLYAVGADGKITPKTLYVPKGKKPLILSLDDLNYYKYMKNGGFANRLVLDQGIVKTEVFTPKGEKIITSDGDAVPIVDEFVKEHPDFSLNGAKGIIAVTGFEGILGYHTNLKGRFGEEARKAVLPIVAELKNTGWVFASHSFTHDQVFLNGNITRDSLRADIGKWQAQVEPLVGPTNIFIGPFGQVFKKGDPRQDDLVQAGYNVLYGVGMDEYFKFFPDRFIMNRINIDGYRILHNPKTLIKKLGISVGPMW